jgi:hypothetical protein
VAQATAKIDALNAACDGPLRAQIDAARVAGAGRGRDMGVFALKGALVAVAGSSASPADAEAIARITAPAWDGVWRAEEGGFLEFDFRRRRIALTGYAIRVAPAPERSDLRAWAVRGWRQDAQQWVEIDSKEGNTQIAPDKDWVTFPCGRGRGEFTNIRFE